MLGGFRAREDQYDLGHRSEKAPKREITLASIGYWIDDPRPIAKRLEALLRVIEDLDHYAARLAQRLYAWRGREDGGSFSCARSAQRRRSPMKPDLKIQIGPGSQRRAIWRWRYYQCSTTCLIVRRHCSTPAEAAKPFMPGYVACLEQSGEAVGVGR